MQKHKMKRFFKNREVSEFGRMGLLLMVFIYIGIRIMDSTGLFVEELKCGVETTAYKDNKEYFEASGYRFDNANWRTNERALEGFYSVKLTPENQYGFSITLGTPKAKEEYEGSVWYYVEKTSADTTGLPFLVATIGKSFWKGATEVVQKKDGWNKLEFKIIVPDSVYKDPLVVYCWNNTKNAVYFDNMTIKRHNYLKFFRQ